MSNDFIRQASLSSQTLNSRQYLAQLHLDYPLLLGLLALCCYGLVILYSASGKNFDLVTRQAILFAIAFIGMGVVAQISPRMLQRWAIWGYLLGLGLLIAVLLFGDVGKGAQRWLVFAGIRFQPSELMKLAVPIAMAWFLSERPLPPRKRLLLVGVLIIAAPVLLIAKQPDLGTAILIGSSGVFVLLLAGVSWRLVSLVGGLGVASTPVLWFLLHDYQRQRVLTFLKPENDPLGAGWNIIQSKIAIGSGGIFGKGWLHGTQSHLDFLPERSTDFIFAVCSEEFGLVGVLLLLAMYLYIVGRGLYIAMVAQDTFGRLLAGSLTLTFFVYFFVNIGMVTGLLPVVGLPLPLISRGGTSLMTLMAGFGVLMAIHTHRRLIAT